MAVLLKNVTNSIWHAFNALQQERNGFVNKTKLKVLTANIATLFDLYGVEKGLDHFRSTASLSFEHFRYYLQKEVFSSIINTLTMAELRNYEMKIDEICWLVCRKNYTKSINQNNNGYKIYTDEYIYKLFRIFCMIADLVTNGRDFDKCEVLLHPSEASKIVQQLMISLGLDYKSGNNKYDYLNGSELSFRFEQFLSVIEFREYKDFINDAQSLYEAVEEMYQTYIMDVIKKGYLLRRGYLLPTMREYWFVLQPCELSYYKHSNEKDLCGSIILDSTSTVKPQKISGKHEKIQRLVITTNDRNYELATLDHRTRMQWISALQLAITYSVGREGFQRDLVARRRNQRDADKSRKREEEILRSSHIEEVEKAKLQLELEKMARVAAEKQARELRAVAREDSRRVAELEDVKQTLEKLLDEEIQAKRDEEIVRALQARVLAEEWEKREELEQLQEEQRCLLDQERQKRLEFEMKQREKEKRLRDAETRLKELEDERGKLDTELQQARSKIQQSEETKEVLEARLQVMHPPLREGDRVRRALSFMPSTKERPVNVEVRSSTLRRPNKILLP